MQTTKSHEESGSAPNSGVPMISIWYEAAAATVVFNSAANNFMRSERNMRDRTLVLYVKFDVLFIQNDATLATVDRVNGSRSIVSMNWINAHSECDTLCKYMYKYVYMLVGWVSARARAHSYIMWYTVEMKKCRLRHRSTVDERNERTERKEYQIIIIIDRARPSTKWLNIWI